MRQFAAENQKLDLEWFNNSNYICLLSVNNENDLLDLIIKAKSNNVKFSIFREPDLNNTITAICLEPGKNTKKIVSNIKLAFK